MIRGLVLGLLLAMFMVSCVVRRVMSPRLTGTCAGACAHYSGCKPGSTTADRTRCERECPDVFSDPDSLMAYESLTCTDAVEYVDGSQARTAATPAS